MYNNFYQYLIASFEQENVSIPGEPEAVTAERKSAFALFKEKGFPTVKNEEWKYTSLNRFLTADYQLITSCAAGTLQPPAMPDDIKSIDCCRAVFVNGVFIPSLSDELPEGVTLLDGAAALGDPAFADKFLKIAQDESNPILALNTAFFRNFYFLNIAKGKVIEKPIYFLHTYTADTPAFIPYRIFISAERTSQASLIETFYSDTEEAPIFVSYVTEQFVDEAAVLNTNIINNLTENISFVEFRETQQQQNSVFHDMNISFPGAALIRNNIHCRIQGQNAEANLWGIYLSGKQQLVDNHTIADHQVPNCVSNEHYKGILLDKSHGVFSGRIIVRKDAQKTNAFQQNNNLLLTDQAIANSKPQLEIFADDVKCSHGSTFGQLDQEAMFYLKTRGISEETANKIMIEAFAYDVLSRIEIESLRGHITDLIHKYLENREAVTEASI